MKFFSMIIMSSILVSSTQALVITSIDQEGVVEITATESDDIVVSFEGNALRVNNLEPSIGPITADQINGLNLIGSDDPNTINFTGFDHPDLDMDYRINIFANGGDDTVIGVDISRFITYGTSYIDLGSGDNTLNLENSNLIFYVIKNDLSANDTVIGTNLDFSFLWRFNDSGSNLNSTIEIAQDEIDSEFITLHYDNGTVSSTSKLRGIDLVEIKCSDGDQLINVSGTNNMAVANIIYNLGDGNDTINTLFIEGIRQDIIGSENESAIDTLNFSSGIFPLEHDTECGVLLTSEEQGDVVYLNLDNVNITSQEIDVDSDIWQIR